MDEYSKIKAQVERCLEEFMRGDLTQASLHGILEAMDETPPRQQLLFLRVEGWTIHSGVIGMLMLDNGEINEGPLNPEDWPYKTVIDAIQDGWRVIKFLNSPSGSMRRGPMRSVASLCLKSGDE
jgi:hypothetical protein